MARVQGFKGRRSSFPICPSFKLGFIGGLQMQANYQKRSYTPQFSNQATISVRRLAWAMGISMPAAINIVVQLLPSIVDPAKICKACRDSSKCQSCTFHNQQSKQEQDILSKFTSKEQNAISAVF